VLCFGVEVVRSIGVRVIRVGMFSMCMGLFSIVMVMLCSCVLIRLVWFVILVCVFVLRDVSCL